MKSHQTLLETTGDLSQKGFERSLSKFVEPQIIQLSI